MIKKRKIILIAVSVTLALAVGVGGLIYANNNDHYHEETGGNKLIGVGEMGYYDDVLWGQYQEWDTQFIITNPNCEKYLTIEWVALIAGEDACEYYAEEVIFEGPPDGEVIPYELSPHEGWQVSIAELIGWVEAEDPESIVDECDLGKYTLEVTWSGVYYSWWWRWSRGRPLTGWQKEKCWYVYYYPDDGPMGLPGMAMSEAEMKLFPSRTRFRFPWWYD